MKKITATLAAGALLTFLTMSCENHAAKKDLRKANSALKEAASETNKAAKAQAAAEWELFNYTSDTTLARLETEMTIVEKSLDKMKSKDKAALQLQLKQNKDQLKAMQDRLKMQNKAFEAEMKQFDQSVSDRNKAFQQEFDHDMVEFGVAFRDLFKDNVK